MASQTEQASPKTYRGNCHCGKFVYEVKLPEIKKAYTCNCSNCFKKGLYWNFPATPNDLTWVKGDEKDMTVYTFGKGELTHHFCPNCGVSMIGKKIEKDGAVNSMTVNVRTIQGPPGEAFDLKALELAPFNGAALEPKYVTPANTVPAPSGDGTLYRGNCHCGGLTWALNFRDLNTCASTTDAPFQERIVECNCSMCQRGGYIWVYPSTSQFALSGRDTAASYYTMGTGIARKMFCKKCGVHVINEANPDLSEEEVEGLDPRAKQFRGGLMMMAPLNVRTAEDWELVKGLETLKNDGWTNIPGKYENP